MADADIERQILSNPFEAWRPWTRWDLDTYEVFEANDSEAIAKYVETHGPATIPLLRQSDAETQARELCTGRKPDHRLQLFGSIQLYKKGQAKRLINEPGAAGLRALHLMSPGTLDALLAAPEWPFTLVSLRTDFAPKAAQLEAMASHSGFESLEFLGLYNTLKERLQLVAKLPWLAGLRALALHFTLDKAKEDDTEALAAVPFERLEGLVLTAKDWSVPAKVMRPIVDASWLTSLKHIELAFPHKSPKLSERFVKVMPLEQVESWKLHGAWSEATLVAAFERLAKCKRLNVRPTSPDSVVGLAPAEALLRSGCVPNLWESLDGFSDAARQRLGEATDRDPQLFGRVGNRAGMVTSG